MYTKIADLKAPLVEAISLFEKEERRRRRRVLGVKKCRKKTTFITQKSPSGTTYIDHLRKPLCASAERLEKIHEFMKTYYDTYNKALVNFIQGRSEEFPEGTLKMRTLFRVDYISVEEELFEFQI